MAICLLNSGRMPNGMRCALIGFKTMIPFGNAALFQSLSFCLQAAWEIETNKPNPDWPSEGRVEFRDFKVRYRPGLDLVLKGLTFTVQPEEKVQSSPLYSKTSSPS